MTEEDACDTEFGCCDDPYELLIPDTPVKDVVAQLDELSEEFNEEVSVVDELKLFHRSRVTPLVKADWPEVEDGSDA